MTKKTCRAVRLSSNKDNSFDFSFLFQILAALVALLAFTSAVNAAAIEPSPTEPPRPRLELSEELYSSNSTERAAKLLSGPVDRDLTRADDKAAVAWLSEASALAQIENQSTVKTVLHVQN